VGALRFPGTTLKFSKFGAFVEFFQTEARTRPKRFPALTLAFGSIRVDGQLVLPAKTGAVFHAHVPDFARLLRREGDSQHAKEFRKIFADDERALLVFIRDQEKVFREKDEEYRVFP
jgi:hypothetical protein